MFFVLVGCAYLFEDRRCFSDCKVSHARTQYFVYDATDCYCSAHSIMVRVLSTPKKMLSKIYNLFSAEVSLDGSAVDCLHSFIFQNTTQLNAHTHIVQNSMGQRQWHQPYHPTAIV